MLLLSFIIHQNEWHLIGMLFLQSSTGEWFFSSQMFAVFVTKMVKIFIVSPSPHLQKKSLSVLSQREIYALMMMCL